MSEVSAPRRGRGTVRSVALVVAATTTGACAPAYRLRPATPLTTAESGIEATVEGLELEKSTGPDPERTQVVVRVTNASNRTLPFDPARLRLAKRDAASKEVTPSSADNPLGSPIDAAVAGASAGGQLSGGHLGGLGSAVGAGVGLAAAAVVMLPIAIVLVVKEEIERPPSEFRPGRTARFKVDLGKVSLNGDEEHFLVLGEAFGLSPTSVRLPLVATSEPHGGYSRPAPSSYVGFRVGGGPVYFPGPNSGLGGIQVLGGWYAGRVSFGPVVTLVPVPAMSGGVEVNYVFAPADGRVLVAPLVEYEAHVLLMGGRFAHGPSAGIDVLFPVSGPSYFGWPVSSLDLGFYVKAGPVWRADGEVGMHWQIGFTGR